MTGRDLDVDSHSTVLVFRFPRNWTGVVFFGLLGAVHWGMALGSMRAGAQMSVVFGGLFAAVAGACLTVRREIVILPDRRRIVVRSALWRRVVFKRAISFSEVNLVRVTLVGRRRAESSVTIVCEHEGLELPPSNTPRQEGLLLAMTMGVRLVKVYGDGPAPGPGERIARLYRNEDAV